MKPNDQANRAAVSDFPTLKRARPPLRLSALLGRIMPDVYRIGLCVSATMFCSGVMCKMWDINQFVICAAVAMVAFAAKVAFWDVRLCRNCGEPVRKIGDGSIVVHKWLDQRQCDNRRTMAE